jgi:hypothetical protein
MAGTFEVLKQIDLKLLSLATEGSRSIEKLAWRRARICVSNLSTHYRRTRNSCQAFYYHRINYDSATLKDASIHSQD